jgi:hypothetical protein
VSTSQIKGDISLCRENYYRGEMLLGDCFAAAAATA